MIEVSLSSTFLRAFKRLIKDNIVIKNLFYERLEIFLNNPFDKKLKSHKLTGN